MLPSRNMKHSMPHAGSQLKLTSSEQQSHQSSESKVRILAGTKMLEGRRGEGGRRRSRRSITARLAPQINSRSCLIVLAVFSTIQLMPLTGHQRSTVVCQGFEDLNSNKQIPASGNQLQQPQNSFQSIAASSTRQNANQRTFQRPVLSTRFAPSSAGSGQHQSQSLSAQASYSASIYSEPPAGLASAAGSGSSQQTQQPAAGVSSIEQMMKNALARTAQLNSAAAEPRQDNASAAAAAAVASLPESSIVTRSVGEKPPTESTEITSDTQPATGADDSDKQTTAAQATTTANAHETVYSDQRFANLFARRGSGANKKRLQPMEQVRAKPTLPSFIKSLPDPKQFSAAQAAASDNSRPSIATGSNSFASQRLLQQQQQQQQGRINLANQQKKSAITSNSANNAQNKRTNALNNAKPATNPTSSSANSRSAGLANAKAGNASTSKPIVTSSNNPFSRSQGSSSDPANVIAMARKRLLANNALESAKLKQQQSNKPIAT